MFIPPQRYIYEDVHDDDPRTDGQPEDEIYKPIRWKDEKADESSGYRHMMEELTLYYCTTDRDKAKEADEPIEIQRLLVLFEDAPSHSS